MIETHRLFLRPFSQDDIETYAFWLSEKSIMQFIGDGNTRNYKEAWNNLAWICGHYHLRGYSLWAAEEKASGKLIGRIGLFNPEGWPGIEVSWLLSPEHWGKGYATEGAEAAIRYGFNHLKESKIISLIHPGNLKSILVAKRLGMEYEKETSATGTKVQVYSIHNR